MWLVEQRLFWQKETVVVGTPIGDSTNCCKTIVGIDASQLKPYSMCQATPTSQYRRWILHFDSAKLKPPQIKTRDFEKMVMSYSQRIKPQLRVYRKKLIFIALMACLDTPTLCLKPSDNFVNFVQLMKLVLFSLTKKFKGV